MSALDIGIDLGTTKIIIYKSDVGEILREPAVVALNTKDDSVIAVGTEALRMLGRTPGYIRAEYPLIDGVISDHVLTEVLLKECIKRACNSFLVKHRVVICVPSSITEVEKRAVVEAVVNSGGRKVYLIEEPIAAAIGAGIDISKPNGSLIVDIGGGTTDVAVTSMSGIVISQSMKYAGNKLDEEIIKLMSIKYKLSIGKKMAEKIKQEIGTVYAPDVEITAQVKGRNLLSAYPQQLAVNQMDVFEAVSPYGDMLVDMVKRVLDKTPPELIGDILENGVILTGGGSLLKGIPELIEEQTHVHTVVAEHPVECVSIGTGKAFQYLETLQTGFTSEPTYNY